MEYHSSSKMINALFNERGLAKYTCRVIIHTYDHLTRVYTGPATTRVLKGTGIPANTTFIQPTEPLKDFQSYIWDGYKWVVVWDYRGRHIKCLKTGKYFLVNSLGSIPEGFVLFDNEVKK